MLGPVLPLLKYALAGLPSRVLFLVAIARHNVSRARSSKGITTVSDKRCGFSGSPRLYRHMVKVVQSVSVVALALRIMCEVPKCSPEYTLSVCTIDVRHDGCCLNAQTTGAI